MFDKAELSLRENLRIKNEVAIRLFQDWIVDETGYDKMTWEKLKGISSIAFPLEVFFC